MFLLIIFLVLPLCTWILLFFLFQHVQHEASFCIHLGKRKKQLLTIDNIGHHLVKKSQTGGLL